MNENLSATLFEAKLKKPQNRHIWQTNQWWCFTKDNYTLLLCPLTNLLYITENGNTRDFLTVNVNRSNPVIEGDAHFKIFWDLIDTNTKIIPNVIWLLYRYSNRYNKVTNDWLSYNKISTTLGFWIWDGVRIGWNGQAQNLNV